MSFYLFGNPGEVLKLASFGATVKGAKGTIRIVIETSDLETLGYALRGLQEVQKGQRAKPVSPPKPLALPAPEGR